MLRSLPLLRRSSPSLPPLRDPRCLGYMAGVQSSGPSAPFPDFEVAYEILKDVAREDPAVIRTYEDDLWTDARQRFVHSTKAISVIDTEIPSDENGGGGAIRSLVNNRTPGLIQTSVRVPYVNAPGPTNPSAPPPLTGPAATHLGGLALSLPLWLCSPSLPDRASPSVAICGAGGCSLPVLLASRGATVRCCEPCPDTIDAANARFGAAASPFSLERGDAAEFLSGTRGVDVLIIDAADDRAPPLSMREPSFWSDLVLPSLSRRGGVVAVNFIGDPPELASFRRLLRDELPDHDVFAASPPPVAGVSDRHRLLFAVPKDTRLMLFRDKVLGKGYVVEEEKWVDMLEEAMGDISKEAMP